MPGDGDGLVGDTLPADSTSLNGIYATNGIEPSQIEAAAPFVETFNKTYNKVPQFYVLTAYEATRVALRVYLVASGKTYLPMPGGLVRASDDPAALDLSILAGDTSKDAWVLSEGPVRVVSLLQPPGQPVALKRSGAELPSRVADNLRRLGLKHFWSQAELAATAPMASNVTMAA